MRFMQTLSSSKKMIFVIANPDILRIKEGVSKITYGLDKLEVLRSWVGETGSIHIDGKNEILKVLKSF